ncbi:MAG: isoprenyl transferase [Paludibacteraceae bacterium]|nr:isoprenyl transferase [Paludibacteraceae bacterium]
MSKINEIDRDRLPQHVSIIMDGNGRWAKERGQERIFGHKEGVDSVDKVVEAAAELGIKYISMYAFSTENWNRPKEEVAGLMEIFATAMSAYIGKLMQNNVRIIILGDLDKLSDTAKEKLVDGMQKTASNTGLTMILFISYSSRWEIIEAVKNIAKGAKSGEINIDDINDDMFSSYLCTKGIPDPDLMIRTSGEQRISNFLMWQLSYAELYFSNVSWPEFKKEQFFEAIADYQKRQRRFGKTGEQIENKL